MNERRKNKKIVLDVLLETQELLKNFDAKRAEDILTKLEVAIPAFYALNGISPTQQPTYHVPTPSKYRA